MSYLLVFFIISLVITLHELGHLLAARRLGIHIVRFSIGFGPKLWGFRMGETEYWISLIPCGGYVMPALEEEGADQKAPLNRILFDLAGPVANVLAAFLFLSLVNVFQFGFSVNAAVFLPWDQLCQMTIQMCLLIPSIFTQPQQLSGIVGIVAAGGDHVGLNLIKLLQFGALLNLNLAIFNLIPILPLDGGKVVMRVLRRIYQPARKLELPLTLAGWVFLLALTLYATALDITRVAHGALG